MKKAVSSILIIILCFMMSAGLCFAGDFEETELPPVPIVHRHSMVYTAAKAPTCTAAGNKAYYYCSGCGQYFSDQGGNVVITKESTVVKATGHKASASWSSDQTSHWKVCANGCGKKMNTASHTWNSGAVTKKPTTASTGVRTYTCTVCKRTKTESIPKIKPVSISLASISGLTAKPFTGKAITPDFKVTYKGKTLKKDTDYTVSYANNKYVGTATVTIRGKGSYQGTKKADFAITKAANTLTLRAGGKAFTALALKSGKKTIRIEALNPKGTVTYTPNDAAKKAGIKVSVSGVVTVPKNCKVGLYKIAVKAKGTGNYKAGQKMFTVKVK